MTACGHRREHALDHVALADDHGFDGVDDLDVLPANAFHALAKRRAFAGRERVVLVAIRISILAHVVVLGRSAHVMSRQRSDQPAQDRWTGAAWRRGGGLAKPQAGVGIRETPPDRLVTGELVQELQDDLANRQRDPRCERLGRVGDACLADRRLAERGQRVVGTCDVGVRWRSRRVQDARDDVADPSSIEITHRRAFAYRYDAMPDGFVPRKFTSLDRAARLHPVA